MTIEINLIARVRFFCASKLLSEAKSCKIIIISTQNDIISSIVIADNAVHSL